MDSEKCIVLAIIQPNDALANASTIHSTASLAIKILPYFMDVQSLLTGTEDQ